MNASCLVNEWVIAHGWICHSVLQCVAVCCSVLQCVAVCYHIDGYVMLHKWMSHITHMNESCLADGWVMSYRWMSHVIQMNESCQRNDKVKSQRWECPRNYCLESQFLIAASGNITRIPYVMSRVECVWVEDRMSTSNPLQLAATRYNKLHVYSWSSPPLQHSATQCNTLQHTACPLLFNLTVAAHTATYCNTLQNTAIHQINLQLTLELQFLGRTISRITWTSLLQPLKQTSPRYNTLQHTHRSKWHFLGAASRQISRQFQLHPMRRLVL